MALLLPLSARAESLSVGTAQGGQLLSGFEVPLAGAYHRFYGPVRKRGTNYATLELTALLVRAARTVEAAAGGPPLLIADCSKADGGDVGRHVSHNSGRDVDVLFYVADEQGKPVTARGFDSFDGDGRCTGSRCTLQFDAHRNWWFVRTLLVSADPVVQYIFVSKPLRALLLRYAESRKEDPRILARARRVLLQPPDSSAHDDHFHIRIYCSAEDRAHGCRDTGPRWSWAP